MRIFLRFLLCSLLIASTLLPGLSAGDPELRDKSLSFPLLISECQDADTPAMVAKLNQWSFEAPPVLVRVAEPLSREELASIAPPPRAFLVPGLLLYTLQFSSET